LLAIALCAATLTSSLRTPLSHHTFPNPFHHPPPLFLLMTPPPPTPTPFPYTTLFRSDAQLAEKKARLVELLAPFAAPQPQVFDRSEEHTSELQSRENLVCRLLLEKKKRSWYGTSTAH